MDLALPPMPFSAVFVPASGQSVLQIPADMRNEGMGDPSIIIELPVGVVQVVVTWKGVDPLTVRHYIYNGTTATFEDVATIPASSTVNDRSTGVITLASDNRHGILLQHGNGTSWNANTLSKGYVAGVQVMPMGTAADITGGGSLLRVDNSVGTRVFLGDTMIHGDTGWRNVTADLRYDWAATLFAIRRVGSTVEARATGLNGQASTANTFFVPPVGFVPYGPEGLRISATTNAGAVQSDRVNVGITGTNSQIWRIDRTVREAALSGTYLTDDSWPSTLPGTAI